MNTLIRMGVLAALGSAVAGCSSLPDRVDTLEQARSSVRALEQDPLAAEAASSQLSEARDAIAAADELYDQKEDLELVEHQAYVAERYARIAEERIAAAHARQELDNGEAERTRVLLEAREAEAERARAQAEQRGAQAEDLQRELAARESANDELQRQLSELQAEQTERGIVLTLGDVLFETAEANLQPGAMSTIDRLADFMDEYPQRRVMIEGHTDSRGSDAFNLDLSERRADSVRDALVDRGVAADRLQAVGLGESYPIASNENTAGMQENRRVEIVISDEEGDFPGGATRTARR
jgi:outer membrane protein OmpA-like peptidoglycan-associated protein